MSIIHDFTEDFKAANVIYARKVFNRALYLENPNIADKTTINTQWVLGMIDRYNKKYGAKTTTYESTPQATRAIANKMFVDHCADNGLIGNVFFIDKLQGDTWNSGGTSSKTYTIPTDCIADISFNFSIIGESLAFKYGSIKVGEDNTNEKLTLIGDAESGNYSKHEIARGANKIENIFLKAGKVLYFNTNGAYAGSSGVGVDSYGIMENVRVVAKLKTNEICIPTDMVINTKNVYNDITKEYPIKQTGIYSYSFIAYNGTFKNGTSNTEKLVKFSIINQNGTETVLENPEKLFDEAHQSSFSGTVNVSKDSKFVMQCKTGSNGMHGVVECLTIKGTTI
jgi:hypothetical protein